jgi:hypothetical protein
VVHGDSTIKSITELTNSYDVIRTERNKVVHNTWAGSAKELAEGFKISARGTVTLSYSYWSASDIEELAKDIEHWTISCINFCEDNFGWPRPS